MGWQDNQADDSVHCCCFACWGFHFPSIQKKELCHFKLDSKELQSAEKERVGQNSIIEEQTVFSPKVQQQNDNWLGFFEIGGSKWDTEHTAWGSSTFQLYKTVYIWRLWEKGMLENIQNIVIKTWKGGLKLIWWTTFILGFYKLSCID